MRVYAWNGVDWSTERWTLTKSDWNDDKYGTSVALSANGDFLAVGALGPSYYGEGGKVFTYKWSGTEYVQTAHLLGTHFMGEMGNRQNELGSAVALSATGAVLAIGQTKAGSEKVKFYDWDGTTYVWRGESADLTGGPSSKFGCAVALSSDGSVVAVGADNVEYRDIDDPMIVRGSAGNVEVHEWNGGSWDQRGGDLFGYTYGITDATIQFGKTVALSANGNTLAVGAGGTLFNNADVGQVLVFDFDNGAWGLRGPRFVGDSSYATLGSSVALSNDGNTLAFGVPASTTTSTPLTSTPPLPVTRECLVGTVPIGTSWETTSKAKQDKILGTSWG